MRNLRIIVLSTVGPVGAKHVNTIHTEHLNQHGIRLWADSVINFWSGARIGKEHDTRFSVGQMIKTFFTSCCHRWTRCGSKSILLISCIGVSWFSGFRARKPRPVTYPLDSVSRSVSPKSTPLFLVFL